MDLVENEEALEGLRKPNLVVLIRYHLLVCRSDLQRITSTPLNVLQSMLNNTTTSTKLPQLEFEKKILKSEEVVKLGKACESVERYSREMVVDNFSMVSKYKGPKGIRRAKKNPACRNFFCVWYLSQNHHSYVIGNGPITWPRISKLRISPTSSITLLRMSQIIPKWNICCCWCPIEQEESVFLSKELASLRFKVSRKSKSLDPEHDRPIFDFATPTLSSQVKSFLRLFIQILRNLSSIASPLHELSRSEPFNWSAPVELSFSKVKQFVSNAPILPHYDTTLPLFLSTDAFPLGLGALLSHLIDKIDHHIAFASCKLNAAEKYYSQIDKEASDIIFGLNRFEHYLLGLTLYIKTDHQLLKFILNQKK
ncbi:unnamed protein product [Lepeophtheirus salmonis]|uniref:(salmon louse) hypothetical protein n=1 Tax=Lepeophtheirus salmonis TaxID=72036 RepID=A0A7R8D085_LEPSM|nr:unnamed protein product [Lepeophtheirus salmonis]CAF2941340.1 unnamed protein product [Lepeophtheirus salmonis]